MKRTLIKLPVAILILLSISSCKKSSNYRSKTQLLTQKPWVQSNVEKGSGENWQTDDGFTSLQACEKDDQIIFGVDKSYEVNEGTSKCEPNGERIKEQGSWEFKNDETELIISGETGTIEKLDESTLVVRYSSRETGTSNYRFTLAH